VLTKIKLHHPSLHWEKELIAARAMMPPDVELAQQEADQQGMLLSEYLMHYGLVHDEIVQRALYSQLIHRVEWIVKLPDEATYEFFRDVDSIQTGG